MPRKPRFARQSRQRNQRFAPFTNQEALQSAIEVPGPEACMVGAALLKVKKDDEAIQSETDALQREIEAVLTAEQKAKFTGCLEGLGRPDAPYPRG